MTVPTSFSGATEFLYEGTSPIQSGVTAGSIDPARVAVVRGVVLSASGEPLGGVTITVRDHAELGNTSSRADGRFDLAVNGGGEVTLDYQREGYLPAQRQVTAPWQDYLAAPDVVLIEEDPQVSVIDLSDTSQAFQVARGSDVADEDGARQATLLIPRGTRAGVYAPDGSTTSVTDLHLRLTEYTLGSDGPSSMPGPLPATSAYTYAVEMKAAEAVIKLAGKDVIFDQPVPFYVDNFLGLPIGTTVPVGYYDRELAAWVPSENGKVIKILSVSGGSAEIDSNGDELADDAATLAALGITDAERSQLGALYAPEHAIWRIQIQHLSTWDLNWPLGLPRDARGAARNPRRNRILDQDCTQSGHSEIGITNQVLGETLRVTGTELELHYESNRGPGHKASYSLEIPLSDASLPPSLKRIDLEIQVAGQLTLQSFPPEPDQITTFTWNGKDAYGRTVQGTQPVTVRVGYVYGAVYRAPGGEFGSTGATDASVSRARQEATLWRTWIGSIGAWDARALGLGGWTLSAQHAYDPTEQVLQRGDGGRETLSSSSGPTITTVAGTGQVCFGACGEGGPATEAGLLQPEGLAVGVDGSLYIGNSQREPRVRRVEPSGIITTVAGNGDLCSSAVCGDGSPATGAELITPHLLALGPDGSLYIGETNGFRVRRVDQSGTIRTFAGTGVAGFSGDDGPAVQARLNAVAGLAVGPDGTVFISDGGTRIRRVAPDGVITTFAGTGLAGFAGDGGVATQARFAAGGIALGVDGSLYIADRGNRRVRRVAPDGIIRTIAGTGEACASGACGDGAQALEGTFLDPVALAVDRDDSVYVLDRGNQRVRWFRPGDTISTLAGTGVNATTGDGGPARQAALQEADNGIAVGPDGAVYVAQAFSNVRVRRISPAAEQFAGDERIVASSSGEEVYLFAQGRHSRTLDALSGALLYELAYDGAGLLTTVTDGDGNVTTIERTSNGGPASIVGPFGHRTGLTLDAAGNLSRVTSPAGDATELSYTDDGLLTAVTRPQGNASLYGYDSLGRLTTVTDPTGAASTLARTGTNENYQVVLTDPLGHSAALHVEHLDNGDQKRTAIDAEGVRSEAVLGQDGTQLATLPDGTTVEMVLGPDPRWGMRVPIGARSTVTTPSGRAVTTTLQRSVTLADPANVLQLRNLTDTESKNGRASTVVYEAASRALTQTSAEGRVTLTILDDRGRVLRQRAGGLALIRYDYDARGRLATQSQDDVAGSRTSIASYGSDGLLERFTNPVGQTLAFVRDADGRVVEQSDFAGAVTRLSYDANGNLSSLAPPERPEHEFGYASDDRLASYAAPVVESENSKTVHSHDASGRLVRIDPPDGQGVDLQYDAAGRVASLELSSSGRHYSYDHAGRLERSESNHGVAQAYAYDGSLLTQETWSGFAIATLSRAYDGDLRLSSWAVNDSVPIEIRYDRDDLPVRVGALELTRDPQSGLVTSTSLSSVQQRMTYDVFGDVASITASHDGTQLYAAEYERDSLGRITRNVETLAGIARILEYGYDSAGRLASVDLDGVRIAGYEYDANGNRIGRVDGSGAVRARYDVQDRLLASGSVTYVNGLNGERRSRLVGGQTTSYGYDAAGDLIGVLLPSGRQIEYLLDGQGRRSGKRVAGSMAQTLLYQDTLQPIAELDSTGAVVSRFVYASRTGVPDYLVKQGVTYSIIADHRGSPRLVVDSSTGQIAQRVLHDEFGNVLLDTNPGFTPFGFAGGLYDPETNLVHFGARDYDPETGRWLSKDPIRFAGGDANLYAYVGNEPVNRIDPDGLMRTTLDLCVNETGLCAVLAGGATTQAASAALAATVLVGSAAVVAALACPSLMSPKPPNTPPGAPEIEEAAPRPRTRALPKSRAVPRTRPVPGRPRRPKKEDRCRAECLPYLGGTIGGYVRPDGTTVVNEPGGAWAYDACIQACIAR